jgi:catechol 2,3-dioxygenase-like lactoylglutathione lyase family enzyme
MPLPRRKEVGMSVGPIEAVRVFTTRLEEARRFYGDTLGLVELLADDAMAMFDTGQAKLIVERIDGGDPEAAGLVGRFTAFSFTVPDMAAALSGLRDRAIAWRGPPERQGWGGILAHFTDPDGNVLTLVEYPKGRGGRGSASASA